MTCLGKAGTASNGGGKAAIGEDCHGKGKQSDAVEWPRTDGRGSATEELRSERGDQQRKSVDSRGEPLRKSWAPRGGGRE